MKIVAGEAEMQVMGAFEDFLYEQDQKRPALRIRLGKAPTWEESTALIGHTLVLLDDNGAQIKTYEGYNAIQECTMTLIKETQAEQELPRLIRRCKQ
jgi:hypothetical protein